MIFNQSTRCSFLVFGVLCISSILARADECDAILSQGLRNTYQSLSTHNLRSDIEQGFCTQYKQNQSGSSGGGASFEIPLENLIPLKFGGEYNQSDASTIYNQSCSNGKNNFNDDNYNKVLSWTVDPEITKAWSQCKATRFGPYINGDINGNIIAIEFRFRPIGDISETILTSDPDIFGAKCLNPIVKQGTTLNGGGITQGCIREGTGPVSVILNTKFGTARFFIPAEVEIQSNRPREQKQVGRSFNNIEITPLPGSIVIANSQFNRLAAQLPGTGKPMEGFPTLPPGTAWCVIQESELPQGNPKAACTFNATSGPCSCPTGNGDGSTYKGTIF